MNIKRQPSAGDSGHGPARSPPFRAGEIERVAAPSRDEPETSFACLDYLFDPVGEPSEPEDEPTLVRATPAQGSMPARRPLPFGLPPLRPRCVRSAPPPPSHAMPRYSPVPRAIAAPSAPRRPPQTRSLATPAPPTLTERARGRLKGLWPRSRHAQVLAGATPVALACVLLGLAFGNAPPADAEPAVCPRAALSACPSGAPAEAALPAAPPAPPPPALATLPPPPSAPVPPPRRAAARPTDEPPGAPAAVCSSPPSARPPSAKNRLFGTED
jgi:hypothetical protein